MASPAVCGGASSRCPIALRVALAPDLYTYIQVVQTSMENARRLSMEVAQGAADVQNNLVTARRPRGHQRHINEDLARFAFDFLEYKCPLIALWLDACTIEEGYRMMPHVPKNPKLVSQRQ